MFRFRSAASRRSMKKKSAAARLHEAVAAVEPLEQRQLMSTSPVTFGPLNPEVTVGAHGGSFAVQAVDINGDGIPDMVSANYDGTVSVALGKGDGTFGTPQTVSDGLGDGAPGNGPQSLAVAYINQRPIIIVSNGHSDMVDVLEFNAAQQLVSAGPQAVAPDTTFINALTVAEIKGDEFLVTANTDGSVSTAEFAGHGSGIVGGFYGLAPSQNYQGVITYTKGTLGLQTAALFGIVSGDFISSGNGGDLAVLGSNGTVSLIPSEYNTNNPTPAYFNFYSGGGSTHNGYAYNIAPGAITSATKITLAHLTSGANDDLLVENSDYSITPVLGGGHLGGSVGNFYGDNNIFTVEPSLNYTVTSYRSPLVVGDFDGDGNQDIIFAQKIPSSTNYEAVIFTGKGDGTFNAGATLGFTSMNTTVPNISTNDELTAADLNGDGLTDIVAWRYHTSTDYANGVISDSLGTTPLAPSFINADTGNVIVGTPFDLPVRLHGSPEAKVTLTSGVLPKGLKLTTNTDGTVDITGTAVTQKMGTFVINLTAQNSAGLTNQVITLTVSQPAKFTSSKTATFHLGVAGTFTVSTTGGLPNTTLTAANLPAGLTFTDNHNGTGTIAGTPTASGISSPLVLLTATDGPFQVTQNLTITVLAAPVISSNPATFTVGEENSFVIVVNDGGTGSAVPTPTTKFKAKLPRGVKIVRQKDGSLLVEGTPGLKTAGTYTITVNSKNTAGAATQQSITLTVNAPPVIDSQSSTNFTVGKNNTFTFSLAKGSFPTSVFTEIGTLPTGVTFQDLGNGTATLSGNPPSLNGSSQENGGVYPITVIAANAPAEAAITITSLTESGTTVTATAASTAGVTLGSAVNIAGATPTGYNGTFIVTHVTPTSFTYTAAANIGANTGATLTATPEVASIQHFNLTVLDPASISSTANASFTVGTSGSFTVTTGGFPAPSLSSSTLPSGLTFTDNGDGTGTISGTPATGTGGVYDITLTAHNSTGHATQNFILQVNSVG